MANTNSCFIKLTVRIATGQRADFLIIDRDPLLATPDELRATRVLQTWIGGQLAYKAAEDRTRRDVQAAETPSRR